MFDSISTYLFNTIFTVSTNVMLDDLGSPSIRERTWLWLKDTRPLKPRTSELFSRDRLITEVEYAPSAIELDLLGRGRVGWDGVEVGWGMSGLSRGCEPQGGPEKTDTFYFVIISTNVALFPGFVGQMWDTAISFYCEKHLQNVHFFPHFF